MPHPNYLLGVLLTVVGALAISRPAHAETYATCAGFIEALPATITTQGTWCLRKDLNTSISSGNAITIATNNVTIDCNNFKIGGLGAGDGSIANGISAASRSNATVRNCSIRGFYRGVTLPGGSGHLVQDNLVDQSLLTGIHVTGENNRVQRNRVNDTGGATGLDYAVAIEANADVIDNTVSGVFAAADTTYADGIVLYGSGNTARGNQVRGLLPAGSEGNALGIYAIDSGIRISDNHVSVATKTAGNGIEGSADGNTFCTGNSVANFDTPYLSCDQNVGNLPAP